MSTGARAAFVHLSIACAIDKKLVCTVDCLPRFCHPIVVPIVLLATISGSVITISFKLFFSLILTLAIKKDFCTLTTCVVLAVLTTMLTRTLGRGGCHVNMSLLAFFFDLVVPRLFSCLSAGRVRGCSLLCTFKATFLAFLPTTFLFRQLLRRTSRRVRGRLLSVISRSCSRMGTLGSFSVIRCHRTIGISSVTYHYTGRIKCQTGLYLTKNFCCHVKH